jgi:hypothetical protein
LKIDYVDLAITVEAESLRVVLNDRVVESGEQCLYVDDVEQAVSVDIFRQSVIIGVCWSVREATNWWWS